MEPSQQNVEYPGRKKNQLNLCQKLEGTQQFPNDWRKRKKRGKSTRMKKDRWALITSNTSVKQEIWDLQEILFCGDKKHCLKYITLTYLRYKYLYDQRMNEWVSECHGNIVLCFPLSIKFLRVEVVRNYPATSPPSFFFLMAFLIIYTFFFLCIIPPPKLSVYDNWGWSDRRRNSKPLRRLSEIEAINFYGN